MFRKILLAVTIFCLLFGMSGILLTSAPYSLIDVILAFMNGASAGVLATGFLINIKK
jgi:hypothetical protein